MKDEELNMWRKEWHTQPAVPIELIRKVERQTVYMRLGKWVLTLPLLILLAGTAGAVMRPRCGVARHSDSARLHMSSQERRVHDDARPNGPRLATAGSPA